MERLLTEDARKRLERIVIKKMEEEAFEIARKKGMEIGIEKTAINMLKEGFSLEDTSRATGLTKNQINQIYISK